MTTLVFPASMPAAQAYRQKASAQGEVLVGASSLAFDEESGNYARWLQLPYVDDAGFAETFCEAVAAEGISRIFCPHVFAHRMLKQLAEQRRLSVHFVNNDPMEMENIRFRALFAHAQKLMPALQAIAEGQENWNLYEVASVLHYAESIYGESGESKILAMMGIAGHLPKGDLVEIGVAWGRTAFVLGMIAHKQDTGNVLAVDPWDPGKAVQKETGKELQKLATSWNWDLMAESFLVNVMPVAMGRLNYLRESSTQAAVTYAAKRSVTSRAFGKTDYAGKIALLHIDGNHDFEAVQQDYQVWRPHLAPGGWIIVDDYRWLHGDGPKRLGDMVLQKEVAGIRRAFTANNALFLQFGDR